MVCVGMCVHVLQIEPLLELFKTVDQKEMFALTTAVTRALPPGIVSAEALKGTEPTYHPEETLFDFCFRKLGTRSPDLQLFCTLSMCAAFESCAAVLVTFNGAANTAKTKRFLHHVSKSVRNLVRTMRLPGDKTSTADAALSATVRTPTQFGLAMRLAYLKMPD
jgi:hypothetical protein